jgi:hypothetical protein
VQEHVAALPRRQRPRGRDELPRRELAGPDARLLALGHPGGEEAGVVADRQEGRGDPAPGLLEAGGVQGEPLLEEEGAEPSLFGAWKSNINQLIPMGSQGKDGLGAPIKNLLCRVYKVQDRDE